MVDEEVILEALEKIKDPETLSSISEVGLLKGVKIHNNIIKVYVNFQGTEPSCKSCRPISWLVINSLVRDIEDVLRNQFDLSYKIIDESNGQVFTSSG